MRLLKYLCAVAALGVVFVNSTAAGHMDTPVAAPTPTPTPTASEVLVQSSIRVSALEQGAGEMADGEAAAVVLNLIDALLLLL